MASGNIIDKSLFTNRNASKVV